MGLFKAIPGINLIVAAFDAIGELFSGNFLAAFNTDGEGGIMEKMGNITMAIFTGFLGSFGQLGDWIVSWFTDDGFNLENMFNKWAVFLKSGLMNALATASSFIPIVGDNMSKYFTEAADDTDKVFQKLENDKEATVISIGKAANKEIDAKKKTVVATKELADKTEAANTRLTNANAGIMTSTNGIMGNVMQTAATIATPVQPTVNNVTPPTVNKETTETPETTQETAKAAEGTALPVDAIVAQLVSMTALLSSMLTAEQMQAAGIEALAAGVGRPAFTNNETKFEWLQGNRFRA